MECLYSCCFRLPVATNVLERIRLQLSFEAIVGCKVVQALRAAGGTYILAILHRAGNNG